MNTPTANTRGEAQSSKGSRSGKVERKGRGSALHGRTAQPEDDPNRLVPTEYHSDDGLEEEEPQEVHVDELEDEEKDIPPVMLSREIDDLPAQAAMKPPSLAFQPSGFRFEKALTEDIYSIMYTAEPMSLAFFFAVLVFLIQFTILVLIFIDLVHTTDDPPTSSNGEINRISIPVDVDRTVHIAQGLSVILIINFTAKDGDLIRGCSRFFNGYDHEHINDHPGATKIKWVMSSLLQASSGVFMIIDLFMLLMQSTTVVGLCLNFAALHFVQDIDDVAFAVAETGLTGRRIQQEVKGVGDIMTTAANKKRTLWMRRILMVTIVIVLYICWAVLTSWQLFGKFACDELFIQFGDAYDPDLALYSGRFLAQGRQSSRTKYVDLSGTYKMRYSRSNKAWVLEPNSLEKGPVVIMSSQTDSFDVTTVADQTWFHNTTAGFAPVDWFALSCHECENRCHQDRGKCENQVCICKEGFFGMSCEIETPECPHYAIDFRTRGTLGNIPGGSFFFDKLFASPDFAPANNMSRLEFNGRFVYLPYNPNWLRLSEDYKVQNFMLFTGRRWMILGTQLESDALAWIDFLNFMNATILSDNPSPAGKLQLLAKSPDYHPIFYSSPVDLSTPTWAYDPSTVTWVFVKPQKNPEESLFFGTKPDDDDRLSAQFLCSACAYQNRTEGLGTCGNGGRCTITLPESGLGFCECSPFYTGFQCEYVYDCNELGCFNGGTCDKITGSCKYCFKGAHGNICQNPPPPAVEQEPFFCSDTVFSFSACKNHQACDPFQLKCTCEPPFYGEYCQESTQQTCVRVSEDYENFELGENWIPQEGVFLDPCLNGGFCDYSYVDYPVCRCPEGYSGDLCELRAGSENISSPTKSPEG
ncbi:neurogenic locus notch homolog protein [Seminavis robusta]|uniref:Neurogenic locus notch homolog protein n=1 Tax=Seminavis robusta TaxID=568900 RepID=A0A9N8H3G2_9STRA|nr:neurogenic locus notch homolog protein [Seminavis robusta]|eukprot:Sro86_g045780.1 neurogenic locus notch homolog protein (868) ;mRNA; r:76869-80009